MRTLGCILMGAALLGAACSDDKPAPADAAVEHMIPADLGQSCGAASGCFTVSSQPGGPCEQRCISVGLWPAICTTDCLTDQHCGPGAPYCTDVGSGGSRACMTMRGDPNGACPRPDAAVDAPVDGPADATND
jgi:hypothetical protein